MILCFRGEPGVHRRVDDAENDSHSTGFPESFFFSGLYNLMGAGDRHLLRF
jgi:hypothetical protein